jgi:hypothetical protein
VHLRTSLVQLFVLLLQNFEKVVQMIELKRFGGAPNGYPFAPLLSRGGPWKDPTLCNVAPGHGRRRGEAKFWRAAVRGWPGAGGGGTLGPRGPIPGLGCGGGGVGEVGRRRPGPVAAAAGIPAGWRLCGSRGAVGELG